MKNKIKYKMMLISIFGVLFGRILNRVLSSHLGSDGSNIVMAVAVTIVFGVILLLIIMGHYAGAIIYSIGYTDVGDGNRCIFK